MLLQLEQECLDIYRRKVEKTRKYKADLHQQLAEAETEIAGIASALGEGFSSFSRVGSCSTMGFFDRLQIVVSYAKWLLLQLPF